MERQRAGSISRRSLVTAAGIGGVALLANGLRGDDPAEGKRQGGNDLLTGGISKGRIATSVPIVDVYPVLQQVDLPIIETIKLPQGLNLRENASYQYGEVRNGHGRCSGAVVTVQIGTSADIEIDFTVNAISEETFNTWKSYARQFVATDAWSYLNESYSGSARAGGFFAGLFGYVGARGNYNHYRNKRDSFRSTGTQEQEGFYRSVHNLDNSTLRMTGRLRAYGVSYIPVQVSAFIEVTIIEFADGKTLRAVDTTNPVAANPQNGSTTGAGSEPTNLNVVPLG